jgi:hypothetical protein
MRKNDNPIHQVGQAVIAGARALGRGMRRGWRRFCALALAVIALLQTVPSARAGYDIVSTDGSGNVTFTPGSRVSPILTGVVAAVGSAAALIVLAVGVRWIYRMVKSR